MACDYEPGGAPQVRATSAYALAHVAHERRLQLQLTQTELAERVGTTRRWIREFEAGKETAQVGVILRLFDALDLTIDVSVRATPRVDLDEVLDRYRR